MTGSTPMGGASVSEVLADTEKRELVLGFAADLYAEIAAFMEEVTGRTYAAYVAAQGYANGEALRIKHITAMSIRDDYKRTTRENREDVALMTALRQAARQASNPTAEGV